jgi:hypothetical protein
MSRQVSNLFFLVFFTKESDLSTIVFLLFDASSPFCSGYLSNRLRIREPLSTPIGTGRDIRANRATGIVPQPAFVALSGKRVVKAIASEPRLEYGLEETSAIKHWIFG